MRVILLWLSKVIHPNPRRYGEVEGDQCCGGGPGGGGWNEVEVLDLCHDYI